ncbi:hypothetical protein [Leminorella grimontii]
MSDKKKTYGAIDDDTARLDMTREGGMGKSAYPYKMRAGYVSRPILY